MMPLGYAAILGGTLTLISTTPNLILGSELERLSGGERTLGMFEFAIVGIPISVVGIAYMALIGTRLLGRRGSDDVLERESFRDRMIKRYQPEKKLYKADRSIRVRAGRQHDCTGEPRKAIRDRGGPDRSQEGLSGSIPGRPGGSDDQGR